MARSRVEGAPIAGCELDQMRMTVGILADAAQSVPAGAAQFLNCTPTATRIITLPAVTSADNGKFHYLRNGAASGSGFDLTVNNAAASTIGTVAPLEAALLIVIAGAWVVTMVGLNT